jgi:cell fate (sporulation/competence/biofilm development) regulator YlbF (YheA/YmcA/DUF963 family)
MMKTKEAKGLIQEFESAQSGIERLADAGIAVRNIRIRKTKIIADVLHLDYSDNSHERFNDVEYPIDKLVEFKRTRVIA